MDAESNRGVNAPPIYDEFDSRLMSEEQKKSILKAWEEAIPKLDKEFVDHIVFGTNEKK